MRFFLRSSVAFAVALAAASAPLRAAPLPPVLAPPAPFPLIVAQSFESDFVAPGVRRGRYLLATSSGPLTIEVVAVDTREPTIRLDPVLAADRLVSSGETVSSMAIRTHAVAGINADYFDIGQTNQPLNIVVKSGSLIRTPSRRAVLDIGRDKTIRFENFRFSGVVHDGNAQYALTAINEFPPQGGASFVTPQFGAIPASATAGITMVSLAPVGPLAAVAGKYTVTAVGPAIPGIVAGPTLAFGPAALAAGPPPVAGDTLDLTTQSDPPLEEVVSAVGGGPMLLANGKPYDDPESPAPEERDHRFPLAGAAASADGTLFLIAVDGRQPAFSVGLTRPEFGALMRGLGATDGMAFDSGGSATLVARILGEPQPRVLNAPSDGVERPVADGFFVYSDAPPGPPSRLVVRPDAILALAGATLSAGATRADAAGHYLGSAPLRFDPSPIATLDSNGVLRIAASAHSGTLVAHDGPLRTEVPVTIADRIAKLTIEPEHPNPNPGDLVKLIAHATDASGRTIVTGEAVRWTADRGTFPQLGVYKAVDADGTVTAVAAGVTAKAIVRVGHHDEKLAWFTPAANGRWQFSTVPRSSGGAVALEPDAQDLRLDYDFTGSGRAAYANGTFAMAGEPLGISLEIQGDGSGVALRAAFLNRFGERNAVTLAKSVDWRGWQRRTITLPGEMNPPISLVSIYAVNSLGTPPVHGAGTIRFRNPLVVVAGSGGPGAPR